MRAEIFEREKVIVIKAGKETPRKEKQTYLKRKLQFEKKENSWTIFHYSF